MKRRCRVGCAALVAWVTACGVGCARVSEEASRAGDGGEAGTSSPPGRSAASRVAETTTRPAEASTQTARLSEQPGRSDGCKEGMVRVEGDYCPAVVEECVEEHDEYKNRGERTVSERCLRYKEPTICASKQRAHLSFCMDRFEYPNRIGEIPRVLTSWKQAVDMCAAESKRLCTEDEFNFACEGPEMKPYVYGYDRDPSVCTIDLPYRYPDHSRTMLHYEECQQTPWCAAELARLDQRRPIGEVTTCVSWAGIYDLNGNVNEWVEIPKQKAPNRSGLKGGWWGPVRNRCRPTVTFHKEDDYGYEVGFRCCDSTH